jgi:YHS domain-containing protein
MVSVPIDPVCGIEIKQDLALSHQHKGEIFYFCCDGCKKIFIKKPRKYRRK